MISRWHDATAQHCDSALSLRAYTSRLIGGDPALVLYGGGNTSVKTGNTLHVKATGTDLATVGTEHFTALKLDALRALMRQSDLSDADLMRRINDCKVDPSAPAPSIETLMHAVLPYSHVEHAHADAVLAVANVAECGAACATAFGNLAPVVPYRHSGAALARACHAVFDRQASEKTIGLILAFHGVVAFGHSARESYDHLLQLVTLAEEFLQRHAEPVPPATLKPESAAARYKAETLRAAASDIAGFPLAMKMVRTPSTLAFAQRPDLATLAQQGPPTPQHAIYTKRVPLLGEDIARYADQYRAYLARTLGQDAHHAIDAAPRIAIDPDFGLCAFGVNAHYAAIAAEIYQHDIGIMTGASTHGQYRSAGEVEVALAELEYGGFEQRVRAGVVSTGSAANGQELNG